MRIEDFESLLGVPPYVANPLHSDWSEFEDFVGRALPVDYKEFVSSYGPCCLSGTLLIFHPKASQGDTSLNLFEEVQLAGGQYEKLKRTPYYEVPYPIHPDPHGCIPVARTSGGNQIFLLPPKGAEDEWNVVMDMGEWVNFPSGFTYFLHEALSGNLHVPFLQEEEPSFEPVGFLN
ncbi:SMI1/KNR4 family protein [Streptomyces sp. GSL17-111]|uniref:SMI1/KNR4 family protein n=1 Tax=Streptomyces sp. GSL17-111 TaxID=3121596 RepID=UPI0030F495A7